MLYRAGTAALHKMPDGLSRNPPMRDKLFLCRIGEWIRHRNNIKGIQDAIEAGEFEDEDQHFLTI